MFKFFTHKTRNAKGFQVLFDFSEKKDYTEIHIQKSVFFNEILSLVRQ